MSETNARTIQETRFETSDDSSWTECPNCEKSDVDVVVRRASDERGVLVEDLTSATVVFECPHCDAGSTEGTANQDTEGEVDVMGVLMLIPPLFDSDAPTEDRLRGGLVLGTLLAVVGYAASVGVV